LAFRTDSIAASRVIPPDYFLADEASLDVFIVRIMMELLLNIIRLLKRLFFGERIIENAALAIGVVDE
jgi:hypothetical protein